MRLRVLAAALLLPALASAQQQDLGHRVLGTRGLEAGSQEAPGLYAGWQVVWFEAERLRDRRGEPVDVPGLRLEALAGSVGASFTARPAGGPYLTAAFGVPGVRLAGETADPRASLDRQGLGNVFVQPLKVGVRTRHADAVASYAFFAPTGQLAREGLARPQWSHVLSLGGTAYFDRQRAWHASALASWTLYQRKPDLDLRRGDTLQVQGGVGGRVLGVVRLGLAFYALGQVRDDTGEDLPPLPRGLREQVGGLGPELSVDVPEARARLTLRATWDVDAAARPQGATVVAALSALAWAPRARRETAGARAIRDPAG